LTTQYQVVYEKHVKSEVTTSEFYRILSPLKDSHLRKSKQSYFLDEHTALEIFDEVFMSITDCILDIERWLNRALHRRRIDAHRQRKARSKYEQIKEYIPETTPIVNEVECSVIQKEEADHRQVIDFILRTAKPDATTTAIVEAYLIAPPSATRKEIARSLGLHHEIVKRKLLSLSRHYDANRFGEHYDYLAV